MKNHEELKQLTNMAALSLSDIEAEKLFNDIRNISQYLAEKLSGLDTRNTEPMVHVSDITNVFRDDNESDPLKREELLSNAPETVNGCFAVPKIIEAI